MRPFRGSPSPGLAPAEEELSPRHAERRRAVASQCSNVLEATSASRRVYALVVGEHMVEEIRARGITFTFTEMWFVDCTILY